MPLPSTYSGTTLKDELALSQGEQELWGNAQSTTDHAIILLSKCLEKSSESNDRHAKAMNWLTFGIFFVGILQVVFLFCKNL
jgi:hypothetical protein